MTKNYDLVIIGTGTAARVAAMRVRKAGWRVAVIDCRPFGGTCALRGCDPKKMLVGGASAVDHVREQLPPRIALVGGGYIAAEFSHIAARAGAQVTVLLAHPRECLGGIEHGATCDLSNGSIG